MSAEQMILTVLATKLAQAVAEDNDNPDGHDIASGLYGPAVSEWLREVAKEMTPAAEQAPIDMVLHCPACGEQHIDAPEWADGGYFDTMKNRQTWSNPPHRSHLCHGCGHIWRPADVPTNGVAAIKTKGKADSPPAPARQEWQPIETAPRDQFILVSCPSGYTTIPRVSTIAIMHSDYKTGRWVDHANDDLTDWGMVPTHWQPRPADPFEGGA